MDACGSETIYCILRLGETVTSAFTKLDQTAMRCTDSYCNPTQAIAKRGEAIEKDNEKDNQRT